MNSQKINSVSEFKFDYGVVTYKHRFNLTRSLDDYETVGSGRAKPEYIVTFNKDKNTISKFDVVKEKASISENLGGALNSFSGSLFMSQGGKQFLYLLLLKQY